MCDKGVHRIHDNMRYKIKTEINLCGSLTLKGDPCRNKVKEKNMKCRFHTVKEKIECDECPVCYDSVPDKTFTCGHSMCTSCYERWSANKNTVTCPMCRTTLRTNSDVTVPEYNDDVNQILSVYILEFEMLNRLLLMSYNDRNYENT